MTLYQHDLSECFRFQIDGELHDSLVRELDGCWKTAASTLSNRPLVVDLRFVTSWNAPAIALLGRMHLAGAQFVAATGQSAQLFQLVTGEALPVESTAGEAIRHSTSLRQKIQGWLKPATQLQLPS